MTRKIIILIYFSFSIGILSAQITKIGEASFYADKFEGRLTASGVVFKQNKLTAAHRTLPFGSKVRVTNLDNNKTVEVIINDRGPFVSGRIIDLSKSAARKLDFIQKGTTKVEIRILNSLEEENTKDNTQTKNEQVATNNDKQDKKITDNTVNKTSNIDYFEVDTKKVSPKGFGIQVASYQEATNLIRNCNEIKSKTNKNVLVQIGKTNGQKIYRIIIGSFSNRVNANKFNKKLKNKFTGSFVVSL